MRFLSMVLAFASFSAMACPNLAGRYASCVSESGQSSNTSDVVVSQSAAGGVVTYTVTETDDESGERDTTSIPADGVARTETDDSGDFPMTTVSTTTCSGDTLVNTAAISTGGEAIGSVNITIHRDGARMVQVVDGMIMGAEISDTIVCE